VDVVVAGGAEGTQTSAGAVDEASTNGSGSAQARAGSVLTAHVNSATTATPIRPLVLRQ
jgi:hypothetical protein